MASESNSRQGLGVERWPMKYAGALAIFSPVVFIWLRFRHPQSSLLELSLGVVGVIAIAVTVAGFIHISSRLIEGKQNG